MTERATDWRSNGLARLIWLTRTALQEASTGFFETAPGTTEPGSVRAALRELRDGVAQHGSALGRLDHAQVHRIVAEAQINASIEVVADLVRQLAEIADSRTSRSAIPEQLLSLLRQMSHVCVGTLAYAAWALDNGSTSVPGAESAHAEAGQLQRQVLKECADADLTAALDAASVGRLYERFTEHAVSIARQAWLLTGATTTGERQTT